MKRLSFFILFAAVCLIVRPLAAQFGVAVATDGEQVFVSKAGGAYGGLALVYVMGKNSNGSWQTMQKLHAPGSTESGEALTPSVVLTDDLLLIGAADPEVRFGAHLFKKNEAQWDVSKSIPLDEQAFIPTQHETMGVQDFFRYVYPPPRILAHDNGLMAIAVAGKIHLYRKSGNQFALDPVHPIVEARGMSQSGQFGASVDVIGGHHMVAGAPRNGDNGSIHIFTPNIDASWGENVIYAPDAESSGFGSSLLSIEGLVLVSAPGTSSNAGVVYVFPLGQETPEATLLSPEPTHGDQFGASIAHVGDEVWIGAPGSNNGDGTVYRFARGEAAWSLIGQFDGKEGEGLGATLASSGNLAVAGAPGADGGIGRALLFEQEGDDWVISSWLYPDRLNETIAGDTFRCEDGNTQGFACNNVDLHAFLPIEALGGAAGEQVSDLWGWTDPDTGSEYAMIGRTGGAAIVDVTNPSFPVYLGLVPANPTPTRDLKVYQDHLYFTGDGAGEHGLVVFDLKRLRSVDQVPASFLADTTYRGIASAHNLIIDEESGFAYAVGSSGGGETCGGGLHMIDIRQPLAPSFAGCYTDTLGLFSAGRTHDAQCTVYKGPDEDYQGRQICFVSNETALRIVDVTDKSNPNPISAARYPKTAYVHQGWLTEDQHYYYLDDELDEVVGMTEKTRTIIWDVADLDDPVLVSTFEGHTTATDHNLYVKGDRMYQANYQGGMRIWDISNPLEPEEIGHFDTTPYQGNPPGFSGAWTAYPYFESGTVIVSSMDEGLFVVRPREEKPVP